VCYQYKYLPRNQFTTNAPEHARLLPMMPFVVLMLWQQTNSFSHGVRIEYNQPPASHIHSSPCTVPTIRPYAKFLRTFLIAPKSLIIPKYYAQSIYHHSLIWLTPRLIGQIWPNYDRMYVKANDPMTKIFNTLFHKMLFVVKKRYIRHIMSIYHTLVSLSWLVISL
jgi:hypothetical protein